MRVKRDDVLAAVRRRGPVLPLELKQELGEDSIIIGAMLSELASAKLIDISSAKIGGSPVYFTHDQREGLSRLRPYLNEKDRSVYDRVEREGVVDEDSLSPVERAGVRSLKDFCVMLPILYKGEQRVFWKWHLLSNDQAIDLIKQLIASSAQTVQETRSVQSSTTSASSQQVASQDADNSKKGISQLSDVHQKTESHVSDPINESSSVSARFGSSSQSVSGNEQLISGASADDSSAKSPVDSPKESVSPSKGVDDDFLSGVCSYLSHKGITIKESQVIRAKTDVELVIEVPFCLGMLSMYCRARNKKRCGDADVASAYLEAQRRHLPVVLLVSGELAKKVRDSLAVKYPGLVVVEGVS